LAALAIAVLAPAGASADSVKIGSTLQNSVDSYFLTYAGVQLTTATPRQIVSPADGVVTAWGTRTGLAETYSFWVLHPKNDGSGGFTVTGGVTAPGPTTGAPQGVYSYSAPSIPIAKGDFIALGADGPDIPRHNTGNPADVLGGFSITPPSSGGSLAAPTKNLNSELLLQATVKFCNAPDVAGKKVAVAKQLITAADCTPVVSKKKAKKKKRKRVIRQTTAAGTTGVPGTTVAIVVGKKGKK
jgi:hypothetical protein